MPLVTDYQLTDDPMHIAARQVLGRLRAVTDIANRTILESAEFGLDSVLWDVLYGGAQSPADIFPMCRIFYMQPRRRTDDGLGGIFTSFVPLSFYFLYYIGVPSGDATRTSFVEARENHIRTCLDSLRMDRLVPAIDGTGGDVWRWTTNDYSEDHETPFKYLDASVMLSPETGFTCSRVDWEFWCKGYVQQPITYP